MYTSISFSSLLLAATLAISFVLAQPISAPALTLTLREPKTCSLLVQRWNSNAFDVAYYSAPLTDDHKGNNEYVLWNQENDSTATSTPGSPLADYKLGAYDVHIRNMKNPSGGSVDDVDDVGSLAFNYGALSWDSSSDNCFHAGKVVAAGFYSVSCNFPCDV